MWLELVFWERNKVVSLIKFPFGENLCLGKKEKKKKKSEKFRQQFIIYYLDKENVFNSPFLQ